jgi:RCR-type E3 ubiquitin transferase
MSLILCVMWCAVCCCACGAMQVDALSAAPSIRLACGHVYHAHCVKQRIETKWPGQRINFKFLECPLVRRHRTGVLCFLPTPSERFPPFSLRFCAFVQCNASMDHPFVNELLIGTGLALLKYKVYERAKARAKLEKLERDSHVTDAKSAFYNDVLRFAMSSYAYFVCRSCKDPYFGGRRDCEANAREEKVNPDELVCFSCSDVSAIAECKNPAHQEFIV